MIAPVESTAPAAGPTHAQLVEVAARWLRKSRGCSVVLAELASASPETPDAIGWSGTHWSILIEVKISRADFFRDAKKPHRSVLSDQSVGQERYYLAPKGLIRFTELPEGWGLLEWDGKRVYYGFKLNRAMMDYQAARVVAEVPVLVSALRRHQQADLRAVLLAIGELDKGQIIIARKVLERRARALAGLPEIADDEPVVNNETSKEAVI